MAKKKRARTEAQEEEGTEQAVVVAQEEAGDEEESGAYAEPSAGGGQDEQEGQKKRKRKRKRKKAPVADEGGEDEDGEEDETGAEPATTRSEAPTVFTAYVEGISYEATEEDVQAFFQDKGCGKVVAVRMPRYQDSNRPRGYAHLDFKKAAGLEKALTLNGQHLMGRYLKVARAKDVQVPQANTGKEKPPGCRTVFVKNLPYEVTEDDVREAFTFCGKIANVRLAVWNHTKARKGFGYVDFEKEASAEIAVKKQGTIRVGGRLVVIDYEAGKPKGSFRTLDGQQWRKVAAKAGGAKTKKK